MKDKLLRFLNDEILAGSGSDEVGPEDDLLISGLVDSIGVMRLISFIEETFGIHVPPEEVTIERFRSVSAIADYLETKSNGGQ